MPYRPKLATGHDQNHFIIRDFLQALPGYHTHKQGPDVVYLAEWCGEVIGAIDTSRLGGVWLDWFCFVGDTGALVEVKTEEAYKKTGHSLREGEAWTIVHLPILTMIVSNDYQVLEMFSKLYAR